MISPLALEVGQSSAEDRLEARFNLKHAGTWARAWFMSADISIQIPKGVA